MQHTKINHEALEKLRARLGKPVQRVTPPFYTEINADAARHFASSIGDDNPLYIDPEYAAKSRWKSGLATPCILYSTNNVVSGAVEGLPGVHAMFAGTDWTWHQPIRHGTRIRTEATLKGLVEHETRFAGRAIQQIYAISFFDQNDTLLATADSWCFRTERESAKSEGKKYKEVEKAIRKYTEEELDVFRNQYRSEKRRGAETRYFDDVNVGDQIDTILKGPYTLTSVIAFMQSWGNYGTQNHRIAWDYFDKHPKLAIPNAYGVPEGPARVHWDAEFAREVGVPAPYDFGPERIAWLSHLMTDWMGDDGFLRRLNVRVRDHNLLGDATWCKGTVTGKRVEDGKAIVSADVWCENQRGARTAVGAAEVILPTKS